VLKVENRRIEIENRKKMRKELSPLLVTLIPYEQPKFSLRKNLR